MATKRDSIVMAYSSGIGPQQTAFSRADYARARPDVFFTGHDLSLRSNRMLAQLAGQYAVDLFIGSTLQEEGIASLCKMERGILVATDGCNAHRGAIWALGLLVAAVARRPSETKASPGCSSG